MRELRQARRNQNQNWHALSSLPGLLAANRQIGSVWKKERGFAKDLMDNRRMESELPAEKLPDNQAAGEEKTDGTKQINTSHGDEGTKSIFAAIFHDDFFRFLTGVAIGCWMMHEFIYDVHKIFLFAGIIFTFADVFYVLAQKLLPRRFWIQSTIWLIYFAGMIGIFHFKSEPESIAENKPRRL